MFVRESFLLHSFHQPKTVPNQVRVYCKQVKNKNGRFKTVQVQVKCGKTCASCEGCELVRLHHPSDWPSTGNRLVLMKCRGLWKTKNQPLRPSIRKATPTKHTLHWPHSYDTVTSMDTSGTDSETVCRRKQSQPSLLASLQPHTLHSVHATPKLDNYATT